MKPQPLPIRNVLFYTIGILTLMITLLAGYEVVTQWERLQRIESLKRATVLSDQLFDAIEQLSSERDIAFSMLYANDPETISALHSRFVEKRQATNEAFTIALNSLGPYKFSELVTLRKELQSYLNNIQTLRVNIDEAVSQPKAKRKLLADSWNVAATDLAQQTEILWLNFIGHFTDIDPVVTQHLRFKHFLRTIIDHTGRQRSIIGKLLVENADPTIKESTELLRGQGIIELSWKTTKLLGTQSHLFPTIGAYYNDAESHYLTMNDMLKDMFYVPGARHGATYPIDVNLWFELADQTMESFDALRKNAYKEILRYVTSLETQAQYAIIIHSLLLISTLILCICSFRIINRRVIGPIHDMVDALVNTMQGKEGVFNTPINREDEIGKLVEVLHALQQNMETVRKSIIEVELSRERYRALVEAGTQIVWIWRDGAIDRNSPINQWWQATTGQSSDAIATYGWLELVHPDDLERVKQVWGDALTNNKSFELEYRLRAKDGSYLNIFIRGIALRNPDGSIREYVGSLTDITQRKRAEAKNALLAAIIASSDNAIISKTMDGTITSWNDSAERLFGYTANEAVGQHISLIIPPERIEEEKHIVLELRAGRQIQHFETERLHKNGRLIPVSLTVSPVRDEDGNIIGASKILQDITQRKQAEQALQDYMQALERSNKELDDFAYIASHDLKEPLRGIHNHSRFLLEDNEGKLDDDSVRKLNRLVYLSQRMERLVNDLLYFSRLGRQEMAIQKTDINEVIHDIENTLDVFLAEHQAKILIPSPLPAITCDKPRVTELFRNLITNGVKYNDKADKTIEVGFMPKQLSAQGIEYKNVFYVKDNGRGIAPEFHEEIFRIFKRLQSSKEGVEDGTGVGLTFVKKIVERHGGRIWLDPAPNGGTIFYFTLEGAGRDNSKAA